MPLLQVPRPLLQLARRYAPSLRTHLSIWMVSDKQTPKIDVILVCALGNRLHHYSRVLDPSDPTKFRPLPSCPRLRWVLPHPLNSSAVGSLFRQRTASSLLEGASDGPNRNLKAHGGMEPLGDEVLESSSNYLLFGALGVGAGFVGWLCRRRKRPRSRRTLFGRLPVV